MHPTHNETVRASRKKEWKKGKNAKREILWVDVIIFCKLKCTSSWAIYSPPPPHQFYALVEIALWQYPNKKRMKKKKYKTSELFIVRQFRKNENKFFYLKIWKATQTNNGRGLFINRHNHTHGTCGRSLMMHATRHWS